MKIELMHMKMKFLSMIEICLCDLVSWSSIPAEMSMMSGMTTKLKMRIMSCCKYCGRNPSSSESWKTRSSSYLESGVAKSTNYTKINNNKNLRK